MARVRLYLRPARPGHDYLFHRPNGTSEIIPGLRLVAYVRLIGQVAPGPTVAKAAFPLCILDTGSFLSLVPQLIWQHLLPGVITPLRFDPSMPLPHRSATIAGGTFPYELGEITLPLRDTDGGQLDVTVVAKFTRDGGRLVIPLTLGLRGGVLDGRVLHSEPDPMAPFGQAWWLQDP